MRPGNDTLNTRSSLKAGLPGLKLKPPKSAWCSPKGQSLLGLSILNLNAARHRLIKPFYKPTDETCGIVILSPLPHDDWLLASAGDSRTSLLA